MSFFITTISLIILIYISYIIKIPKVSIPLLGIYILYILIGFFNEQENEVSLSENQINLNSFDEQNTKINEDYFQNNIETTKSKDIASILKSVNVMSVSIILNKIREKIGVIEIAKNEHLIVF